MVILIESKRKTILKGAYGLLVTFGVIIFFNYLRTDNILSYRFGKSDGILILFAITGIAKDFWQKTVSIEFLAAQITVNKLFNRSKVISWNKVLDISTKDASFFRKGRNLVLVYDDKTVSQIEFPLKDEQLYHQLKKHLEALRSGQEAR